MAREPDEKKRERPSGPFGRTRGYFGKKIRTQGMSENSRSVMSSSKDGALSAIRPKPLDVRDAMGGLRGRYKDGGRERFAQMVRDADLSPDMLERIRGGHLKFKMTYGVFFAVCLVLGMLAVVFSGEIITILGGGLFAMFSMIFLALAIRADYSAWQIGQKRFGGFRDYLENRHLPPVGNGSAVVVRGATGKVSRKADESRKTGG